MDHPDWITPKQAAERVGGRQEQVLKALKRGQLAGFQLGRRWCVWVEDIPAWRAGVAATVEEQRRRFAALGRGHHVRRTVDSRRCPRCEMLVDTPGLCVYCQTESRGAPYWLRRCLDASTTPDCMAGRLEAR